MRTAAKAAFGFFTLLTLGAAAPVSAQYASPNYGPGYGPPDSSYDNSYYDNSAAPYDNGQYDSSQYYGDPNYGAPGYGDAYADTYGVCDYYTPPWGYPPDYCDYQLWYEPVYFGGAWLSGPIYYRYVSGVPYYWIRGGWHRDEWRGPRPRSINWGGRNIRWSGEIHHRDVTRGGEHRFDGRNGFGNRTQGTSGGFQGRDQRFNRESFNHQGSNGQRFNRQSFGGQAHANVQPNTPPINGGFGGRQRFGGQAFNPAVTGNAGGFAQGNDGGRHRGGFAAQTQSAPVVQNNGGGGFGFLHPRGEGGRQRGEAPHQAPQANANTANANNGHGGGRHHRD